MPTTRDSGRGSPGEPLRICYNPSGINSAVPALLDTAQPSSPRPVPKLLITGHTGFVGRSLAEHVTAGHGDRWTLATLAEHQDVRDPKLGEQIAR